MARKGSLKRAVFKGGDSLDEALVCLHEILQCNQVHLARF